MRTYNFSYIKSTKQFYRFQEIDDDGVILDRNDPGALFNFGCLYIPKNQFEIQPTHIELTMEAHYEEG